MSEPDIPAASPARTPCARCGARFECGARAAEPCWCAALPTLDAIDTALEGCLCPTCLTQALAAQGAR